MTWWRRSAVGSELPAGLHGNPAPSVRDIWPGTRAQDEREALARRRRHRVAGRRRPFVQPVPAGGGWLSGVRQWDIAGHLIRTSYLPGTYLAWDDAAWQAILAVRIETMDTRPRRVYEPPNPGRASG